MDKIKVNQIVVVEGKYDAIKLDSIIDGIIIPVNGFSIFKDEDKKLLLKELGRKNGIILITDSDTAGFKIRTYIQNICKNAEIINVYIPQIQGKEPRKAVPSKEGTLGVEGIDKNILLKCFEDAGVNHFGAQQINKSNLTYADLFELGLSGTDNSSKNRDKVCKAIGIPNKLSKKSFLEVLNRMTDKEEIKRFLDEKPTLFWDFHGTLTLNFPQWRECVFQLINDNFPKYNITMEKISQELTGKCLPWYTYKDRDTRHIIKEKDGWWKSCNEELLKMFIRCGLTKEEAESIYLKVRDYVTSPDGNPLYKDTKYVLKTLKDRGYKNHLLSNNFPELDELMDKLGLSEFFEGQTISGKIGFAKPRKEIFEHALNTAGNPDKKIMIGDNINDDVCGSKACGFNTIWINTKNGIANECVDYTCYNLTEILDILK